MPEEREGDLWDDKNEPLYVPQKPNFKETRAKNAKEFEMFCEQVGAQLTSEAKVSDESAHYFRFAQVCRLPVDMEVSVHATEGNYMQIVARQKGTDKIYAFYIDREDEPEKYNQMVFVNQTHKGDASINLGKNSFSSEIKTLANEIRIHNLVPQYEEDSDPNNVPATDQIIYVNRIKKNKSDETSLEM